jgi:hypothetical protein
MFDYDRPESFDVNVSYHAHAGFNFRGRGLLTWKPDEGLNIEAFSSTGAKPKRWNFSSGKVQVLSVEEARSLRIQIPGFGWGIVPNNFLKHQENEIEQGRISIAPEEIYFFHPIPYAKSNEWWCGNALYAISEELEFPDKVQSETKINDQVVEGRSSGGLWLDDDADIGLTGRNLSKTRFQLSWSLSKERWTKTECWKFGETARRALSIIFGQTIRLLRQDARRGGYELTMLRTKKDVDKLNSFHCPMNDSRPLLEQWALNKTLFVQLVRSFQKKEDTSRVCYTIFLQMAEASRQKSWEGRELLLSTILEAALRTIDKHPFRPKDHSWKIRQSMASFQAKYLSDKWSKSCERAIHARDNLRHRNAHPDWLVTAGGAQSNEAWCRSMEDISFLSQFYGYLILVLAGVQNLEPKFRQLEFDR